jgi:hypothetical protein
MLLALIGIADLALEITLSIHLSRMKYASKGWMSWKIGTLINTKTA